MRGTRRFATGSVAAQPSIRARSHASDGLRTTERNRVARRLTFIRVRRTRAPCARALDQGGEPLQHRADRDCVGRDRVGELEVGLHHPRLAWLVGECRPVGVREERGDGLGRLERLDPRERVRGSPREHAERGDRMSLGADGDHGSVLWLRLGGKGSTEKYSCDSGRSRIAKGSASASETSAPGSNASASSAHGR